MNAVGADFMAFARSYGCVALREVHDQHGDRLELVKRMADGSEVVVPFKPDELERLECGIRESRYRLVGHPKHAGGVDPVLGGKKAT